MRISGDGAQGTAFPRNALGLPESIHTHEIDVVVFPRRSNSRGVDLDRSDRQTSTLTEITSMNSAGPPQDAAASLAAETAVADHGLAAEEHLVHVGDRFPRTGRCAAARTQTLTP